MKKILLLMVILVSIAGAGCSTSSETPIMKNISHFLKAFLFVFIFGIISVTANAQKLPAVQQESLSAPANIKIDGKTTEWDNKFQAYNQHTDFYYTLSNDDKNLYLTIQATDPVIIRRIINGGITFTINRSGKKDDKDGMSITYPLFGMGNQFFPTLKPTTNADIRTASRVPVVSRDMTDSTTYITNNTNMAAKSKYIRVVGIKDVDTLISIYNTDGIKTASLFDTKLAYNYELSVPLKHFDLSVTSPVKFIYQLRINEVKEQGINWTKDASGNVTGFSFNKATSIAGQSATDFWGEYTLAKK